MKWLYLSKITITGHGISLLLEHQKANKEKVTKKLYKEWNIEKEILQVHSYERIRNMTIM